MRSGIKFLRHFAVAAFLMLLASCSPEPVKRVKPVPVPVSLHLLCPKNRALEEKLVETPPKWRQRSSLFQNCRRASGFIRMGPHTFSLKTGSAWRLDISELHNPQGRLCELPDSGDVVTGGPGKTLAIHGQTSVVESPPSIKAECSSHRLSRWELTLITSYLFYTPMKMKVKAVYNEILTSD